MARQKFINWRPNAKSRILVRHANEILAEYEKQGYVLTLRQLYYQLVARDIIPNNVKQYNNLGVLVNNARLACMMDWNRIEDRIRQPEANSHWDSPKDIVEQAARAFYRDHWDGQKYYVEVWAEKDAVSNIIQPVCSEWDVTFMANRGYSSASAMYRASKRFIRAINQEREIMILYFGDHDPSGLDMDRDIRDRQAMFILGEGGKYTLPKNNFKRVALTWEQIMQYEPPENPAKETDSRAEEYIARYGNGSWELDALEPNILAELVESQIRAYLNDTKFWAVRDRQNKEAAKIAELVNYL